MRTLAMFTLGLSFLDGEPAGDGDQEGDERESLQKNGSICQSESTQRSHVLKGGVNPM